jgi:hypothetical protein
MIVGGVTLLYIASLYPFVFAFRAGWISDTGASRVGWV